jgi:DNA-binding transcriptional MerR regulator
VDEERYGVGELADEAGVSVRTVRYYIAEGLLPPSVTAGARSYYTRDHLDRLKVIGQLKNAFLPLREIRRQLATFDDETIRLIADDVVVEHDEMHEPEIHAIAESPDLGAPPWEHGFIYGREDIRPSPPARSRRPPGPSRPPGPPSSASSYIARVLGGSPPHPPAPPSPPMPMAPPVPLTPSHDETAWRRVRISDDAELLIRDGAYRRRRDKIDWLVDWARKVLE